MTVLETSWLTRPACTSSTASLRQRKLPKTNHNTIYFMEKSSISLGHSAKDIGLWATILFLVGIAFSVLFNHLLKQHHVYTDYSTESTSLVFSCKWWLMPCFGVAGVVIGLGHPLLDYLLDCPHTYRREWTCVLRCFEFFIGISYSGAKLHNITNIQLSCFLAVMVIAMWFIFDKTSQGFMFSLAFAIIGTSFVQLFVYWRFYSFLQPDFFWIRSWIPCVMFAGSVCVGSIGRQLAFSARQQQDDSKCKTH